MVICVPTAGVTVAPCGTNFSPWTGQSGFPEAVNYSDAAAIWGLFFSMTVGLWFLSKNVGIVISAFRRW